MTPAPGANQGGSRRRVATMVGAGVLVIALLAVFRPGPPGPPLAGSKGPNGTLALRRFLRARGLRVEDGNDPLAHGQGTFVLFSDFRTPDQDMAILQWLEDGGRLVVADPGSDLAARLRAEPRGSIGGLSDTTALGADCPAGEAVAAGTIEVRSSDAAVAEGGSDVRACFGGARGAFELIRRVGSGTAIVLGGGSPFTNALLDRADNAAFAEQVLGSAQPVVFGPPAVPGLPIAEPGGQRGVWGSLPAAGKAALVAVAIAALFFVLVRGRRLGQPVLEEPLSPIPAGELVHATGRLYRKARARGFAAELLRTNTAGQLARRLGTPVTSSPEQLAAAVAGATGLPVVRLRRALHGPDPVDDDGLIALAGELEEIRSALEPAGPVAPAPAPVGSHMGQTVGR